MNQIYILIISMLPVVELKGAIPIAISKFNLPWWQAYIFGVIGSMISAILILLFLGKISVWLSEKTKIFKKFFDWLFDHTRSKHSKKFEIYQELALLIISAVPIPIIGGVWTAALVAFIFNVKFSKAILFIFIGTLIAGAVFTLGTMGVIKI